ncbi:MAG: Fic family protein [Myxococcaceae bacterium]
MTVDQKTNLEALILKLLQNQSTVSLGELVVAAGIEQDDQATRKSLQRMLQSLVAREILESNGITRARVYSLKIKSKRKISQEKVGYQENFLKSYQPNRTEYLSQADRTDLMEMGRSEPVERPAGTYARHILDRLLIDLSWNSSRLEGNTYSLLETKRLIELGETAIGKDLSEAQMILNHKRAIEYLVDCSEETEISARTIYSIHALLSEGLLGNPKAIGRIRQIEVGISGSSYMPLDNPHLIKEYLEIFVQKLNLIQNSFEQSFFALVHLSYLQAFEDVNKRTARLVANLPLIRKNLRPLSFTDVDPKIYAESFLQIYEKNELSKTRELYRWAYQRSSKRYSGVQQVLGEPDRFRIQHRNDIQHIIQTIILEKISGSRLVPRIRSLIKVLPLSDSDAAELFKIIEVEMDSLYEGNIARYKIRPIDFEIWQGLQSN